MRMGGGFRGGPGARRARGMGALLGRLCGASVALEAAAREVAASRPGPQQGRRRMVAVVCQERCMGCGRCLEVCLERALSPAHTATVDAGLCTGCGRCVAECPSEALLLDRRPSVAVEGTAG